MQIWFPLQCARDRHSVMQIWFPLQCARDDSRSLLRCGQDADMCSAGMLVGCRPRGRPWKYSIDGSVQVRMRPQR